VLSDAGLICGPRRTVFLTRSYRDRHRASRVLAHNGQHRVVDDR
jgi:hypothetical protein